MALYLNYVCFRPSFLLIILFGIYMIKYYLSQRFFAVPCFVEAFKKLLKIKIN